MAIALRLRYSAPLGWLEPHDTHLVWPKMARCGATSRGADRRGTIPHMVSIHMRPPEIKNRVMPGHWEGVLIKGARNASAVGTLVERTTLLVALAKMDHATAAAAVTGFGTVLNRINAQRRLSPTYDRGREMA